MSKVDLKSWVVPTCMVSPIVIRWGAEVSFRYQSKPDRRDSFRFFCWHRIPGVLAAGKGRAEEVVAGDACFRISPVLRGRSLGLGLPPAERLG